ncbi:MAG: ATP-dependent 6-phosphofructokinase [Lentisphaeria bacterium]
MENDNNVIHGLTEEDFRIETIGEASLNTPMSVVEFVSDDQRVAFSPKVEDLQSYLKDGQPVPGFEIAGPRAKIFHDRAWVRAAIVTCGGLCPGINDVIKSIVKTLYYAYGVANVYGIPYGLRGLIPHYGHEPIVLTPEYVDAIHENGGAVLGASRGAQDTEEIVRTLDRLSINMLFTIGGDGTQRAAHDIADAVKEKGLPISVVGVPKTIDNDLCFMERTFGYETAVYAAGPVISSAHDEAKGAYNGIGLVKLMGRESGFIAASSCLANSLVNICLIPEASFTLEGDTGLFKAIERRLHQKNHMVIVVAEGAGQNLFDEKNIERDASGNLKFQDIGPYLKTRIGEYLKSRNIEHAIKYFDPSYSVRSVPARGTDAIFCLQLGSNAVHAAMAGKTDMVVGLWQGQFTNVPIPLAVRQRRKVNPQGQLWESVLEVTQQQHYFQA